MKILIVDDNVDNLYYFESLLKGQGHAAERAVNGAEALQKLHKDAFDLIISDIMMPVMDGFQLLQECKKVPEIAKVPFIFITGVYLDREDEELALKLGVMAFLRKPIEPADLIKAIDTAISSKPATAKRVRKQRSAGTGQDDQLLEERLSAKLARKMKELESEAESRKQAETALQESQDQYRLLFESMSQAIVYQDTSSKILSANPAALKLLGLTAEQIAGRTSYDPRWRTIHEDGTDYPGAEHPAVLSLKTGKAVRNVRMGIYNTLEERYRWVTIDAVPLNKPGDEKPYVVCTIFTDITESLFAHKAITESESRLHAILENTDDAIFSIDRDFRLITANSIARRRYKEATGHELIEGMSMVSPLQSERKSFWENMASQVLKGQRSLSTVHYKMSSGNYIVEFSAFPIVAASGYITGFSFFGRDITEKARAADNLHKSTRLFKMLFLCNEAMVHAPQEHKLLQDICRVLVETGGYCMAWVGYVLDDENKTIQPAAYYGTDENFINSINVTWNNNGRGRGPVGRAVRSSRTVILQDIAKDTDYQPWYEEAARRGYAGKVALPLKTGGTVFGVLSIYAPRPDFFTADEVELLEQLAEDMAFGIGSLRSSEQRQVAEASLRESEERFRIASQSTSDLVWEWDIASGQVKWSADIDEMLGYGPGEFPRTLEAWEKALHPEDHDRVMQELDHHVQTGEPYQAEYRIMQKNGTIRHWIDRGLVLQDEKGEIKRSIGACIDITEKRLAEQRSVVRRDLALKLATSTDLDALLEESLQAALKIAGCDAGAIHLLDDQSGDFKLAVHTGLPAEFISHFTDFARDSDVYKLIMLGEPVYLTVDKVRAPLYELYRKERINFVALIPIRYQENIVGCLGVCSHIIDELGEIARNSLVTIGADIENVIERVRSRQQLEHSEQRYRFIADHTVDVIWTMDKNLRYTYFSPSVFRQRGFTPEEMLSMRIDQVVTAKSLEKLGKALEAELVPAMKQEHPEIKTFITELEAYCKDGSTLWSETSMTLLLDEAGKFNGIMGISRDITERKKAEAALRESEEKYRTILDEMNEAYYEIDAHGNYTFFNDTLCRQMGYTRDEMTGMNYKSYTPPDERKHSVSIFTNIFITGIPAHNVPIVHYRKNGSIMYAENTIFPIRDAEGKITGLRGLGHDITERRKWEAELRKRAAFLDSAYDSIIAFNSAGHIVYANETAAISRGFTSEEMLAMNIRQLVPEEDVAVLEERLEMINRLGELSFEAVHITRDGSRLELEARSRTIEVEGDKLHITVYRDITVRKKMQKELIDSETRYRSIVETAGATVVAIDLSGRLTYVNDLGCETLGYSRKELLGRYFSDLIHPDDRGKLIAPFTEAADSLLPLDKTLTVEFRVLHRDGSIFWFYTNPTRMTTDGKAIGFSAVMSDITRLKQAEAALQENEQRYRSLFENNPVAVYMQDRNGRFISVNDATARITGYSKSEILDLSTDMIVVPEHIESGRQHFVKALLGEPQTYEHTIRRKDGRLVELNVTNTAIKVNDKIVGVYSVSEDITERKKAEKDLKAALEMVNATLEGTIDAIAVMSELRDPYTAGHQRMVTLLAVAIARELNLPEEQIQSLRVAGLLHDVGKVYVPSEILSKPGKLSDLERNLAKAHAEAGYEIVKTIKFPWPVAHIIRQHHERMDGSGYPQGLKGEEIMLEARILAVADVVEAMMAHRPYRAALGVERALEEIFQYKDILYYGPAVDACIRLFREKGFTFSD